MMVENLMTAGMEEEWQVIFWDSLVTEAKLKS